MSLSAQLTDFDGVPLASLHTRLPGMEVELGLNEISAVTLALSLEDDVAALVAPFSTKVKVWLRDSLIFFGPVTLPRYTLSERQSVVEITARGAEERLERAWTTPREGTLGNEGSMFFANEDISEIIIQLIENADTAQQSTAPGHGLIQGTLATAVDESAYYYIGKNIWEAIREDFTGSGGVDLEFVPLDQTNGEFAELNTYYPSRGTDRSDSVILECGLGRHTAGELVWEPGGGTIINRAIAVRGPSERTNMTNTAIAISQTSQEAYGVYTHYAGHFDEEEFEASHINRLVTRIVAERAFPQDFFTVTPVIEQGGLMFSYNRDENGVLVGQPGEGLNSPPLFGPDGEYWIADGIAAVGRSLPGLDFDGRARVMGARLTEQPSGVVVTELNCAPEIDDAGVTLTTDTPPLAANDPAPGDMIAIYAQDAAGEIEPLFIPFPEVWRTR